MKYTDSINLQNTIKDTQKSFFSIFDSKHDSIIDSIFDTKDSKGQIIPLNVDQNYVNGIRPDLSSENLVSNDKFWEINNRLQKLPRMNTDNTDLTLNSVFSIDYSRFVLDGHPPASSILFFSKNLRKSLDVQSVGSLLNVFA